MRLVWRRLFVCGCLLASAGAASAVDGEAAPVAQADPVADAGQAQRAPPELQVPGAVPVDDLWKGFLGAGDFDAMVDAYDVAATVYVEQATADAALCREHDAALQRGLAAVPVGLGLWYASYLCAQALGDDARAERDLGAFSALSKHAFASTPVTWSDETPIRITNELDLYALVDASGSELLYAHYLLHEHRRYLNLQAALLDPEAGTERILVLDYLDIWVQLHRDLPEADAPAFRLVLARSLVERRAGFEAAPALATWKLQQTLELDTQAQRLDALALLAEQGQVAAALTLGAACIGMRQLDCATRAVDALLPLAEQGLAAPTVLLSLAFARGAGVERDEKAAATLLDRADRRLGNGLGTLSAVSLAVSTSSAAGAPRFLRKRLGKIGRSGSTLAQGLDATLDALDKPKVAMGRGDRERLRAAALDGIPSMQAMYGAVLVDRNDPVGFDWLHRAAERGSVPAQRLLARNYGSGGGLPEDQVQSLRWHKAAAHGGDAPSALVVGGRYEDDEDYARAEQWYASANLMGNVEGAYQMARLQLAARKGLEGTPADAVEVLRELDQRFKHQASRRLLAEALTRGAAGVEVDRAGAARLLRLNMVAGHLESKRLLADGLLSGAYAPVDAEDGEALLRELVDAGDNEARITMAMAMHAGRVRGDAAEALGLLRTAAAAGLALANNNLAWIQCTSTDEAFHDPAGGLGAARALSRLPNLPPAFLDTIAACEAANGDFAAAIATQRRAIERLQTDAVPEASIARFRGVLAQFERGEVVRETPQESWPMEAPAATPDSAAAETATDAGSAG